MLCIPPLYLLITANCIRVILSVLSLSFVVILGFSQPDYLEAMLANTETVADTLGGNLDGYYALLWRFANVETLLMLSMTVLGVGILGRISLGLFKVKAIVMAGILPAIAGATEAMLALWQPLVLEPVHATAEMLMHQLPQAQQVQSDLFRLEQMLQTMIITILISLLLSTLTFFWRTLRRKDQAQEVSLE